jgi:hypothetical protein
MSRLIKYKEMADILGIAHGTFKNNWRAYPYIPVTPSAQAKPHLSGVRFDPEDVINALKEGLRPLTTIGHAYGDKEIQRRIPGLLQVQGEAVQPGRRHPGGRSGMDRKNQKAAQSARDIELEFDVFHGL